MNNKLFGEFKKCKDFLELNGAKFIDKDDEYYNYDFDGYRICLALDNSEIIFIGDSGDFAHINLSYYELVGFMIDKSFIGVGYKSCK